MAKFVLTAQLRLQAPTNARNIVQQINRQLQGVTANVNVVVNQQSQQQLNKLNKEIKETGKTAKVAGSDMQAFGKQAALAIRRFGAFVTATFAFRRFVNAVTTGLSEAIKFERELIKIAQVTDSSVTSLRGLTREITDLSTRFGVSSTQLLKASRILAQTGLSAQKTERALAALAKSDLAPTFNDIIQTTEGAIAIFRQFKIEAQDLERVLGSINAVAGKFAVESADIITAVRRTGGAFSAAGGSLNELIALFTSVRATTRESAESIATGFRTIFTRLQRARTITFLKNLGIQLRDVSGQFVGPFEAIRRLSTALNQLESTDPRFAQIVEELGGFRQVSKVIPLIQQFNTAQRALNTAQAGGTSLTRDAAKAQQSLAVQLQKVREEFSQLIRRFTNSSAFKTFAKAALSVASALVKIGEAIEPLLGLFSALAVPLAASAITRFLGRPSGQGFLGTLRGKATGFASGGLVPGSGNTDTVPATLTPGEFVLRKRAVQQIGLDNIRKMNSGGFVPNLTTRGRAEGNVGRRKQFRSQRIDFLRRGRSMGVLNDAELQELASLEARQSFQQSSRTRRFGRRLGFADGGLVNERAVGFAVLSKGKRGGLSPFRVTDERIGKTFEVVPSTPFVSVQKEFNEQIKNGIIDAASNTARDLGGVSIGLGQGAGFLQTVNSATRGNLFEDVLRVISTNGIFNDVEGIRGRPFDFVRGLSGRLRDDFPRLAGINYIDAKANSDRATQAVAADKIRRQLLAEGAKRGQAKSAAAFAFAKASPEIQAQVRAKLASRKLGTDLTLKEQAFGVANIKVNEAKKILDDFDSNRIRKASGGSISGRDSVPALLTPGEFVVSRDAVRRIGVGNLERLNELRGFNKGGVVGYQRGGVVQTGGGGGFGLDRIFLLTAVASQLANTFSEADGSLNKLLGVVTQATTQFGILFSLLQAGLRNDTLQRSIGQFVPGTEQFRRNRIAGGLRDVRQQTQDAEFRRSLLVGNRPSLSGQINRLEVAKTQQEARAQRLSVKRFNLQKSAVPSRQNIQQDLSALSAREQRLIARRRLLSQPGSGTGRFGAQFESQRQAELQKVDVEIGRAGRQRGKLLRQSRARQKLDAVIADVTKEERRARAIVRNTNNQALRLEQERDINEAAIRKNTRGLNRLSQQQDRLRQRAAKGPGFFNRNAAIIGATAGVVGNLAGNFVSGRASERIARGEDATRLAGVGGALSGAGTGAAIGAVFGPWGLAIGAAAGALIGFSSATKQATDELNRVKFGKAVKRLNESLELVSSGRAVPGTQSASIASGLQALSNRFDTALKPEDLQNLQGEIRKATFGVEQFFQRISNASTTIAQFRATAGEETLRLFSELSGIRVETLVARFEKEIQIRNKANQINERGLAVERQLIQRIRTISDLTSVFADASLAASRFSTILTDLSGGGLSQLQSFSDLFDRAGNVANRQLFGAAVGRVGAFVPGGRANQIGGEAIAAQRAISQLPDILQRVRAQDPLGQGGDFTRRLGSEITRVVGGGPQGDFIRKAIIARAEKLIGSEQKDENIIRRINEDIAGVAKELGKGFENIFSVLSEVEKITVARLNEVVKFTDARRDLELKIVQGTENLINIDQQRRDFLSAFRERPTNVAGATRADRLRQLNILGRDGSLAGNVGGIQQQLIRSQQTVLQLSQRANDLNRRDVAQREQIIRARDLEQERVTRLTNALKLLTDASSRTASAQKRLGEIRQSREQRFGFARDFIFGDRTQRRGFAQSIQAATAVGAGGLDFSKIPDQFRSGLGSLLQQLSDVRLPAFGRNARGQFRTGRELERNIVSQQLQGFGLSRKQAEETALKLTTPAEEKLLQQIDKTFVEAGRAQVALINSLKGQQDALLQGLKDANTTFLRELRDLFINRERNRLGRQITDLTSERQTAVGNLRRVRVLSNVFGRQIRGQEDLDALTKIIADVRNFNQASTALRGVDVAKQQVGVTTQGLFSGNLTSKTFGASLLNRIQNRTNLTETDRAFNDSLTEALRGDANLRNDIQKLLVRLGKERSILESARRVGSDTGVRATQGRIGNIRRQIGERLFQAVNEAGLKRVQDEQFKRRKDLDRALTKSGISDQARATITKNIAEFEKSIGELGKVNIPNLNNRIRQLDAEIAKLQKNLQATNGGRPIGRNLGGIVPGTGNTDKVPALLTPGEYVLRKEAVQRVGIDNLNRVNAGVGGSTELARFKITGRPKRLQANGTIQSGGVAANLQEAAGEINAGGNLQDVVKEFSRVTNGLVNALNNFPREVSHTITGQVEVIFNGAEVMATIGPEMSKLITARVKDGLNQLIQDKFPDVGPLD